MSTASVADIDRARSFAWLNRGGVQPWMRWVGWELHVGCDVCADDGPSAPCWGVEACHGYHRGCGCGVCAERQASALAATRAEMDAATLSAEFAAISAQLDQSKDRRAG